MAHLAPTAPPIKARSGLATMLRAHPVWSTIIGLGASVSIVVAYVEFSGPGFPDFRGDRIIVFVGVAGLCLAFLGLLLAPTVMIPNARAGELAARHPGSDSWQALAPKSLRGIVLSVTGSRLPILRPVYVVLAEGDLSLWQCRRRSFVQVLRADRSSVVDCQLTDVDYLMYSDAGVTISVLDPSNHVVTKLELWPIIKGEGSSGEIRSNDFNAQEAQRRITRWMRRA